jgi:hypothetical protein
MISLMKRLADVHFKTEASFFQRRGFTGRNVESAAVHFLEVEHTTVVKGLPQGRATHKAELGRW